MNKPVNETVQWKNETVEAYTVPMQTCNLVFAIRGNALLACGAFDLAALEKFNVAAAKVTGVSCAEELLAGRVQAVNRCAVERGVSIDELGGDALLKMSV